MGQAVAVRTDFGAAEVRGFAKRVKDAAQARRLLAIAAVLDGASREDAAKIGGMDRQTLRDWVIRFNAQGPEGLTNIPSPGAPPKLGEEHRVFLARLVEEGPIPAVHGVVRWRACDLRRAAGASCRTIWNHRHRANAVRVASSLCPDMIFRSDMGQVGDCNGRNFMINGHHVLDERRFLMECRNA